MKKKKNIKFIIIKCWVLYLGDKGDLDNDNYLIFALVYGY